MPVAQIDPQTLAPAAQAGKATLGVPDAMNLIIATINAIIAGQSFVLFNYTFTGAEGSHFVINLPVTMASANYGVVFGPMTEPNTFTFSYDTLTTTSFKLRTSAQVPANAKLTIYVAGLTN